MPPNWSIATMRSASEADTHLGPAGKLAGLAYAAQAACSANAQRPWLIAVAERKPAERDLRIGVLDWLENGIPKTNRQGQQARQPRS
jgi:hypothetical protein